MISLSSRQLPTINMFVTKRDILQTLAQIFDPLGWVTPVTVRMKILLQEIWQGKLTWLPDTIKDRWTAILDDLRELPILMPRLYFPLNHAGTHIDNLFVFADASTKAYGAIVYLNSSSQVCLAMSKNRVAPLKAISLTRLELMAVVTATRLAEFVCSSISQDQQSLRVYFWTDSQIVLYWISKATNSKQFISHRVKEIHTAFPKATWSFTPSSDNPADLLTRGLSTSQLQSSHLWTHSPSWLLDRSTWPTWMPTRVLSLQAEEEATLDTTDSESGILNVIDISKYSNFNRLSTVTAYVLRCVHNLANAPKACGPLTSTELADARKHLIKGIQYFTYGEELAYLLERQSKCPPLVRQLRLFLDHDKLIHCGGRIHNAPASELAKFPFLLPSN